MTGTYLNLDILTWRVKAGKWAFSVSVWLCHLSTLGPLFQTVFASALRMVHHIVGSRTYLGDLCLTIHRKDVITSVVLSGMSCPIGSYTVNISGPIANGLFRSCSNLTSVTIGDSVTVIGSSAFYGCGALKSVTIGNSVVSIGSSAFYGCTSLSSVTIGNQVISIGKDAFYECRSLGSVSNRLLLFLTLPLP